MWYNVMCNCMRVYIYNNNNVCVRMLFAYMRSDDQRERESLPISGGSWTGRMPRVTQLWVRGTQWFLPERHDPSPSWIRDLIA
jgi:hypothetical protein